MPELAADFQSLPPEYQALIRLAQDQHEMTITPLDKLVGGWSGAIVYLVSVSTKDSKRVAHFILKLDHKGKSSKADESTRHHKAEHNSPPDFARNHIARMAFERLEHEGAIAIFYQIAGQSLREYRPLSHYKRQSQLKSIFTTTNTLLLTEWNANLAFEQAVQSQDLLKRWLGFRLDDGQNIERFLQDVCHIDPDIPGLLINGNVFHNPLVYARNREYWHTIRPMDVMVGFLHGDLNTNNILVRFTGDDETLEGYYLIDFALFKDNMPLLYDQRYLEMSYLIHAMSQMPTEKSMEMITRLADADILDPHRVPVEMAGVYAVIGAARSAFDIWSKENHPSLHDDLWAQYWLAGVAAGLSYCHKAASAQEHRLAGLVYAAANLKRYAVLFPLTMPGDVQRLYSDDQSSKSPSAAIRLTSAVPHNLPSQPSTFIGREAEISTTRETLLRKEVQLVTLTGPGGTGKSRLSLEVARGVIDHFTDGVFFVPLADILDPEQVVPRIAQQLEVTEAGSQPLFENLKDYLGDKKILLLLDNFEQLVLTAPVIGELLSAAPSLKVLVTSRILLNLRGENELPILPLDVPDTKNLPPLEHLAETESVKLFIERARSAQPDFLLTAENATAVAKICQRLDGLPLAIELAAARIKLLPPQAILARLSDRLKLLTGGAQDLPARQRTLRSTLDWSYSLLDSREKSLYARLAVFVGGFTLEAAEAVCNAGNDWDVLEGIASLVNNSLLRREETAGGELRFRMLETIREYATERLAESGEMEVLQKQHAYHYATNVINEAGMGLLGPKATYWLNRLQLDYDNVLAALAWTQSSPERMELGLAPIIYLNWFWYRRGYFNEGRMWTERVLNSQAFTEPNAARAWVAHMAALLAMWQGDLTIAEERARQGLAIVQNLEDEQLMPWSLMGTGVVLINMGLDREAHPLLKEAQALFEEQGISYMQATALVHLGNVALGLGDPDEAREWLVRAQRLFRDLGEEWGLSFVLNNLGEVARVQGHYEEAGKYYEECVRLLREMGDKGDLARFVHSLGYVALHKEDLRGAEAHFMDSLTMFRRLGNKRGIAECFAGLASVRARQERLPAGAQLLGAAEALITASGAAWWPADRVEVEQTRAMLQSTLGEREFTAAWDQGQAMTMEEAIAFVSDES